MTMTIEEAYKAFTPLIKSQAAHWGQPGRIGLEYADLISVGNEVFISCYEQWDATRSTFGTFLKASLKIAFYNECVVKPGRDRYSHPTSENTAEYHSIDNCDPERYTIFKDGLEKGLSPTAKKMINKVLEVSPAMIDHMIEETGNARVSKRRITRYLSEVESWPMNVIQQGLKEIKNFMAA